MSEDLEALRAETIASLNLVSTIKDWDQLRVHFIGKSGKLTTLLKELGKTEPHLRKERGSLLNRLRDEITQLFQEKLEILRQAEMTRQIAAERIDITLPPRPDPQGGIHPISRTLEEIYAIFGAMGFELAEGPDIETDWHNFSALNIPGHHPARDDHDTFYLPGQPGPGSNGPPRVLRTHTSPVQVRTMLEQPPPIRVIVPGRTYRADHDATHSPMFHQCEGLVIDRDITLAHLKGCLTDFLRAFFGIAALPVRFRASYFPFTEPSMEVDIGWSRATGELGAGTDWLEILGSGMVHPKVLANCGIDPRDWQGFAFGMGVERLTMLKHGMPDLRPFTESDVRWLRHYASSAYSPASLHEGVA